MSTNNHVNLVMEHTPGWKHETIIDPAAKCTQWFAFESTFEPLGLLYRLIIRDEPSHEASICQTGSFDGIVLTSTELFDLGDVTDQLQQWFDDLYAVTAWAEANYGNQATHADAR